MSTATSSQLDFIATLGKDLAAVATTEEQAVALATLRNLWPEARRDKKVASGLIDTMLQFRKDWKAGSATRADEDIEGMHWSNGTVYKVQRAVHGSGHLYAKRLTVHDNGCAQCGGDHHCTHDAGDRYSASFEYVRGGLKGLSTRTLMSLEQAKEFGTVYGMCVVCSATLTDEKSIAAGIGPVCASKF